MTSRPVIERPADDVFAATDRGPISVAQFCADVRWVAERLPDCTYLVNLCQSRYGFMVVFFAAAVSRRITLLPGRRDVADAATIGDIFATRAFVRGATGIVTDGALRDTPAIAAIGKPVYHFASHGATFGRQHMPFSMDEPVTCAGVFVVPGDVIVGDGEGAVCIPIALVEEVVRDALVQEEREAFALECVQAGEPSIDLFPLAPNRVPDFEAWKAAKNRS